MLLKPDASHDTLKGRYASPLLTVLSCTLKNCCTAPIVRTSKTMSLNTQEGIERPVHDTTLLGSVKVLKC